MKIKFSTNVDNFVDFVENYFMFHVKHNVKLTIVCYFANERSLIRFLCVGKDPRIKSEDDILNLLDSSEYRIDVGKGVNKK